MKEKEKRRRYFLGAEVVFGGIFHNLKYFLLIVLCFLNRRHCTLTSARVLLSCFREAPIQRLLSTTHYCCLETVFAPEYTVCVKESRTLRDPAEEAIQIQFATNQISRKWMLFFHLLPLWNWHDIPFRETKWSLDINKSHFKNEQIHISEPYWWWKAGSWGTKKRLYS